MSAPAKVNSDIPLIDLKKVEAAKPPQDRLTLKVHDSLETMRSALENRRGSNPSDSNQLQRSSQIVWKDETKSDEDKPKVEEK